MTRVKEKDTEYTDKAKCDCQPFPVLAPDDEPCCGEPPGPRSSTVERPGFRLWHFVEGFADTPAGPVPRVKTGLEKADLLGTVRVRMGVKRNDYRVAPGLYSTGEPDSRSPVLVTANYKLSFDALRKELQGLDAWLLVVDTRGINVWCAAGRGLFSTREVVGAVDSSGLKEVVDHRELVLPQLAATGVSASGVKKGCDFEVSWGPVKARDIKHFLDSGPGAGMRRITFTAPERLVLVPVELSLIRKAVLWTLAAAFVVSGVGPGVFSLGSAWHRGLMAWAALFTGVLSGGVLVPALLPWIPFRAFAAKGALLGAAGGAVLLAALGRGAGLLGGPALVLFAVVVSSYLAMNFTGATPFTSPSGVEKEMRRAIPVQMAGLVLAVSAWVGASFLA